MVLKTICCNFSKEVIPVSEFREMYVFGDSIAKGVVWSEAHQRYMISRQGCVRLLAGHVPYPVYNRSVMGATAAQCLRELDPSVIRPGTACVFEFGGNDCDMDWASVSKDPCAAHQPKVPLNEFKRCLSHLIALTRTMGGFPILVTPLPLSGERYLRWVSRGLDENRILQYLGEPAEMARWQERWARAAAEVAMKEDVMLVDLRDAMLRSRRFLSLYCPDGIHPNEDGQAYLLDTLLRDYLNTGSSRIA